MATPAAPVPAPEPAAGLPAAGRDGRAPAGLVRFDRVERGVHWANAALIGMLVVTGAVLYLQPLGGLVGRRQLVEQVHVYCGVALPLPLLVALLGPWRGQLRRDLGRFNRWSRADRLWLRSALTRRPGRREVLAGLDTGKFNAGQKLNAAWTAGSGLVMLGTGAIMRWYGPWPLAWRTGATFVHDWLALSVFVVVAGHVLMALRDPFAMRSMLNGRITESWARRHAPAWLAGRDGEPPVLGVEPGQG